MNTKPTIDDLLKESFEKFSPEAPDVWQGISKGIQSAQAAQSGTGLAAAAKSSAVVLKVVSAMVAAIGLTTAIVWYNQSDTQQVSNPTSVVETPTTVDVVPPPQNTSAAENAAPAQEQQPEYTGSPVQENSTVNQVKDVTQRPLSKPKLEATSSGEMKTHSDEDLMVHPSEATHPTVVNPPQVQTIPKAESKPEPTPAPSNQTAETNEAPKQHPPKRPYNPNEGEAGFDKSNIPNVFTPNNDGVNDRFVIEINQEIVYHLMITDANGRMVFESFDKTNTWDGKDQKTGIPCQSGKYRWVLQYQFKESDKQPTISGLLQLIN